jgi:two-component system response regulator HydG
MRCGGGALADIVGRCPAIESLRSEIRKLAPSEARVHVFGETGTGKERVALALHELSPRASKRFVPMNAAAITDDLLPTELFGSVRGAYTGAETRNGYIAEAEGGTLFIEQKSRR